MSDTQADLRAMFRDAVWRAWEARGEDFDFDRHPVHLGPGNLWDGPCSWSSPSCRLTIGELPPLLDDHPYREEIAESFEPDAYRGWAGGLNGLDDDVLWDHFREVGYASRAQYSRRIWESVDPAWYAQKYSLRGVGNTGADARVHYGYIGRFEDQHPNPLTAFFGNLRIHLWQMGKVGSKSIQRAIESVSGLHCMHLHYVDAFHRSQPSVGVHYSRLLKCCGEQPKLVICGVRDPVDRVVSGYFQEAESRGEAVSADSLSRVVHELGSRLISDLRSICSWFHHGFFSDIDVYAQPFDCGAGFEVFESGGVRVLLYRFASFGMIEDEIARFVGMPGLRIPRQNVSRDKSYGDLLDAVRRSICLPSGVLESLYSSRYAEQFLTPQEREMACCWLGDLS